MPPKKRRRTEIAYEKEESLAKENEIKLHFEQFQFQNQNRRVTRSFSSSSSSSSSSSVPVSVPVHVEEDEDWGYEEEKNYQDEVGTFWTELFETKEIVTKQPAFGMPALLPPSSSCVSSCVEEMTFAFMFTPPEDYVTFCREIGGGMLGRCRIFPPTEEMNQHDLRTHTYRIRELFRDPSFDREPIRRDLVVFAKDVEEDSWFAWNAAESDAEKKQVIFCVDESEKSPPPIKIAKNFTEFVTNVCLGSKMKKLGVRKVPANPDRVSEATNQDEEEDDDDWDDDEDDKQKEEDPANLPPKIFKPFPSPN